MREVEMTENEVIHPSPLLDMVQLLHSTSSRAILTVAPLGYICAIPWNLGLFALLSNRKHGNDTVSCKNPTHSTLSSALQGLRKTEPPCQLVSFFTGRGNDDVSNMKLEPVKACQMGRETWAVSYLNPND